MILNYSRLQVGEFNVVQKTINVSDLCSNLIKEFDIAAKNKLLDLSFQNDCGDALIIADEYSINLVVSNLLDNAIRIQFADAFSG